MNSPVRTALLTSIGVLAFAAQLFCQQASQTTAPPEAPRFDTEVVVTPERGQTPRLQTAPTTVLTHETLKSLPVVAASEMLSFLPGVFSMQAEFYSGRPVLSSRGFFGGGEAEYMRLLVDGVPVSDVESGLIDWSVLPVTAIKRVVTPGPNSVMAATRHRWRDQILTAAERSRQSGSDRRNFQPITSDATHGHSASGTAFTISGAGRHTNGAIAHHRRRSLSATAPSSRRRRPAGAGPAIRVAKPQRPRIAAAGCIRSGSVIVRPGVQIRWCRSPSPRDGIRVARRDPRVESTPPRMPPVGARIRIDTVFLIPGVSDTRARTFRHAPSEPS